MGEFFHGWRRKFGVVTLLMALAFTGGWIRGFCVVDTISFANTESMTTVLGSSPSGLGWSTVGHPFEGRRMKWESAAAQSHDYEPPVESPRLKLSSYGAFYFLSVKPDADDIALFSTLVVRYWSIVIPLTLISFWLLLFKPRSSDSKQNR